MCVTCTVTVDCAGDNRGIFGRRLMKFKQSVGNTEVSQFNNFVPRVCMYRVSQEECARLREGVPYVKVYRYNPKHLCPKLNGYRDNGQRSLKL